MLVFNQSKLKGGTSCSQPITSSDPFLCCHIWLHDNNVWCQKQTDGFRWE